MNPRRDKLNRAYYQSTRRSFTELESYLGRFFSEKAVYFDSDKLERFLLVLEMDDKILQQILFQGERFPPTADREMLSELKDFLSPPNAQG